MKQSNNQFLPKPQAIIDIQSDAVKALIELNKTKGQGQHKSHPLIKDLAFRMMDMGYPKSAIAQCLGVSHSLAVKWAHKRRKERFQQRDLFDPAPVLVEAGTIQVIRRKPTLLGRILGWFR